MLLQFGNGGLSHAEIVNEFDQGAGQNGKATTEVLRKIIHCTAGHEVAQNQIQGSRGGATGRGFRGTNGMRLQNFRPKRHGLRNGPLQFGTSGTGPRFGVNNHLLHGFGQGRNVATVNVMIQIQNSSAAMSRGQRKNIFGVSGHQTHRGKAQLQTNAVAQVLVQLLCRRSHDVRRQGAGQEI